ncbi:MAG TPA: zinc dependent phospholipase C family protein [Candidatus Dormibacteraeota bacterium]|nr:zinc dependent phospholipase C family protein [Candidatus Dormibacteraeota bacterium]
MLKLKNRVIWALAWSVAASFLLPQTGNAYSVLSHQAVIDSAWEDGIKPALLAKYPAATREQLKEAHAYVYGGAIIQDLGYYPYGKPLFSDLTHYVRSGDFVLALLRDARDLDEYAFALGAMAHYAADNNGHKLAVNRAVPILYPKLKKKYGDSVTYEDDKLAHVKTEFGFDVLEVAKERYAPDSYHDFIGFEVSERVLNQAFEETYGLDLEKLLIDEHRAIGSYRNAVKNIFPKATRIAWHLKKDEIQRDLPGMTKRKFLYNLKRASFEKNWGNNYQKPSFGEKVLAFIYVLLPKFGPLKVLQFKTPTPETEKLFQESFNETLDHYRQLLHEEQAGKVSLPNDNFDVGADTGPGKYKMNDEAHAELVSRLADEKFTGASPALLAELETFYADPNLPYANKKDRKAQTRLQAALEQLKALKKSENAAGMN